MDDSCLLEVEMRTFLEWAFCIFPSLYTCLITRASSLVCDFSICLGPNAQKGLSALQLSSCSS